jgi:hypothetical protein
VLYGNVIMQVRLTAPNGHEVVVARTLRRALSASVNCAVCFRPQRRGRSVVATDCLRRAPNVLAQSFLTMDHIAKGRRNTPCLSCCWGTPSLLMSVTNLGQECHTYDRAGLSELLGVLGMPELG